MKKHPGTTRAHGRGGRARRAAIGCLLALFTMTIALADTPAPAAGRVDVRAFPTPPPGGGGRGCPHLPRARAPPAPDHGPGAEGSRATVGRPEPRALFKRGLHEHPGLRLGRKGRGEGPHAYWYRSEPRPLV